LRPERIVLPTPFAVGPVNAYLYVDDPITVVDPGPLYPPAQAAFAAGLRRLGIALRDIRQVVVTHHHPDHVGYAPRLAEESGARLLMHPEAAARTAAPRGDQAASEALLRRHGVPESILDAMRRELTRIVSFMTPLGQYTAL
jgi:glyoxylase-like metal-dependent hydrolase (beta-lactamase superfamily II)